MREQVSGFPHMDWENTLTKQVILCIENTLGMSI